MFLPNIIGIGLQFESYQKIKDWTFSIETQYTYFLF